ncbi:TetR family transcriptional regulator [Prauserella sp. PE36]|uniref:TetR family transcriptional regulator n=1 Tax=Prauserella endophytica TaxID=1592324 RepID=A0ABY2S344_9PSEU|nr:MULTISPECIES: TetR family transcriptional regulator [Prauserella]PXY34333.1 TetR family transcriptional regulator [Prauserella coralliicola]RBM23098.1 TetR family transcriptional regulator [Prauserella sp. PE36]TKG69976.1 TetR family transcriptional regulator [Prauserella endophytica]
MTTSPADKPVGLRERKKARTRAAIQDHALRLFTEQGYAATTVEQIAEAAEVSQSTFFRYFPTKEDTVLYDRLDPVLIEHFVNQPADVGPIAAIKAAVHAVFRGLSAEEAELEAVRQRLVISVPDLRAKLFEQFTEGMRMLHDAILRRLGRERDDFAVRMWTGALTGVILAAYVTSIEEGGDFLEYIDRGLTQFERGLPL